MLDYYCHDCDLRFRAEVDTDYGTYEFGRCPHCDSARTTLA